MYDAIVCFKETHVSGVVALWHELSSRGHVAEHCWTHDIHVTLTRPIYNYD